MLDRFQVLLLVFGIIMLGLKISFLLGDFVEISTSHFISLVCTSCAVFNRARKQ